MLVSLKWAEGPVSGKVRGIPRLVVFQESVEAWHNSLDYVCDSPIGELARRNINGGVQNLYLKKILCWHSYGEARMFESFFINCSE